MKTSTLCFLIFLSLSAQSCGEDDKQTTIESIDLTLGGNCSNENGVGDVASSSGEDSDADGIDDEAQITSDAAQGACSDIQDVTINIGGGTLIEVQDNSIIVDDSNLLRKTRQREVYKLSNGARVIVEAERIL